MYDIGISQDFKTTFAVLIIQKNNPHKKLWKHKNITIEIIQLLNI